MSEIWKDVKGFEGRFKVSNFGRVLSINGKWKGEKILTPNLQKSTGYYGTTLHWVGKFRNVRIHVLVAEAFLDKPSIPHVCVNHKDGNKLNNHVDNLEWTDKKANCAHAVATGLHNLKGENHPQRILTDIQAYAIKYKMIGFNNYQLANIFGVCREQIRDMRNGKGWNHITESYKPISSIST